MLPVFDGHNDVLTREDHAGFVSGRADGDLDLPRMRAGGMRGGIFAVFTESRHSPMRPVPRADGGFEFELASRVSPHRAAAESSAAAGRLMAWERAGRLRVGREIEHLDAALSDDGPPVAVLHLEGAEAISPSLEALELWYAAGLRSLGPVWSRPNAFGHGVQFVSPSSPDIGPGLTDAGRALVRRCADLGILVDLSHLNDAGFWDVARIEAGPLVASHSGAHRLCQTSRNLTDAQLDAIGESGGLVGIVFACPFLRPDFAEDPDTPPHLIVEHARYVADRIGVEHVALGSDFDGAMIPRSMGGAAGIPALLDALSEAGFTEDEVAAIAWKNWRRVLAAWWRG
ncbi:MAG: dipeptidase [Solirubrobacteraceae bacterium]